MNKRELENKIIEKTGNSRKEVRDFLHAFVESVAEGLREDQKVSIANFGSWVLRERKERIGISPQNPEKKIKIAGYVAPAFKTAKNFKYRFNK